MKFDLISEYFEKIDKTSSRLEMVEILKDLFLEIEKEDIQNLIYFCQGTLGPKYKTNELNIGQGQLISLISEYLSLSQERVKEEFLHLGDIGLIVEKHYSKRKQETLFSKALNFTEVFETFTKISKITGKGATEKKQQLFKYILFNSSPLSAKYLLRFPISFRLGFGDSTIIEALAKVITKDPEEVKEIKEIITEKYNLISDLGFIANIIKAKKIDDLKKIKVTFFMPIKSQLAERAANFKEIKERIEVMAVDTKIDGFRQQIHKKGNNIVIFSRQEEDITKMFPDIVEAVKKINHDFIIDCESIAYDEKNNKYHPFQVTITRKRKFDINKKAEELPLHLKVFDCLFFDNKEVYFLPYKERRDIVDSFFNIPPIISPTKIIITEDLLKVEAFFNNALKEGFEGIIAKSLTAPYSAGSRGFSWIKFKRSYKNIETLDTIDAVIVGAFYGQGKRTDKGIGALLVAIYDKEEDKYFTLAKIGTGLTDEILIELSEKLNNKKQKIKPKNLITNIIPDYYVDPEIIVEINYDDITKSPTHTTSYSEETKQGLALRFPRLVKVRADKSYFDTTTRKEIERLYSLQENKI